MSDSDNDRNITDWRTESKWFRRKPGAGWLFAFLAIPLLLALIGAGTLALANRPAELTPPSVAASASLTAPPSPSMSAGMPGMPGMPGMGFAPFSMVRGGNGFTLAGELTSEDMKAQLVSSIQQAIPGVAVVDNLTITPGVTAPGMSGLGGLFGTALKIPDFSLKLENDVVTLTGTAPSEDVKAAAEADALATWPNVKIVNNIQVTAASSSGAPPSPPPTPPPGGPGTGGGPCATLQADITSLLKTPINFTTNGTALAGDSTQLVAQIASKVKSCTDVKVSVTGYTDNTGSDAINVPLSASRAKAVADALIANGVTGGNVTSNGAGSANPIAGNDSPAGRAQNRRVEITVS
jgi:peptidoglycan-binding protein ArfA